jgi:sec-independent protein translocase protein TatA
MELGIGEIVVILVLVLIFFGPSKLPQLGDALGRGIRNFKRAAAEDEAPGEARTGAPALPATASQPTLPTERARTRVETR